MSKDYDDAMAALGANLKRVDEYYPETPGKASTEKLVTQMETAHAIAKGSRWGWSTEKNTDQWNGAFLTRDAAIQDAREHSWKTFFVVSGTCPDAKRFVPDAETIIDMIASAAYDAASEAAEDFPDVSPEGQKELDELLTAWAAKHLKPCEFWIADGEAEQITE